MRRRSTKGYAQASDSIALAFETQPFGRGLSGFVLENGSRCLFKKLWRCMLKFGVHSASSLKPSVVFVGRRDHSGCEDL
jgi:hypothetical protein